MVVTLASVLTVAREKQHRDIGLCRLAFEPLQPFDDRSARGSAIDELPDDDPPVERTLLLAHGSNKIVGVVVRGRYYDKAAVQLTFIEDEGEFAGELRWVAVEGGLVPRYAG